MVLTIPKSRASKNLEAGLAFLVLSICLTASLFLSGIMLKMSFIGGIVCIAMLGIFDLLSSLMAVIFILATIECVLDVQETRMHIETSICRLLSKHFASKDKDEQL